MGIAVLGSVLSSSYHASIRDHLGALPLQLRHQAPSGFAATTRAAKHLEGAQGHALSSAARAALAGGFSAAMVVASVVLVMLAIAVLVFQHPARYLRAADPTESLTDAEARHSSDVSGHVIG